jgi:hypothetical protein
MKMMIPPLGTNIRLVEDWNFNLHYEHRNESIYELLGAFQELKGRHGYPANAYTPAHHFDPSERAPVPVVLPAKTLLTIDRYYIRQGAGGFDSVPFLLPAHPRPGYSFGKHRAARFWAELEDVNEISFEFLEGDQPWWFGAKDKLLAGEVLKVKTDYVFLYDRATVELRPLNMKAISDFPEGVEFVIIGEGARIVFVRPDLEQDDPKTGFMGCKNSSVSNRFFRWGEVIGYVVKP